MRRKALEVNLMVILVVMVAVLLIYFMLTRFGSGQINLGIDSAINRVKNIWVG